MADYKLSELNSIDTIRSDDLLHVRVKKRPEMLGDEDRRMTYQDFLASFKLERFVQIAGSTMTGDLGIVKLLYGGKAVFDPTDSSEITMGDVLKAFKINANGLKLTIADASRSATVYHTLNKPSPNELGMRTNEENDARYARLAVTNTFNSRQTIVANGEQLTLRSPVSGDRAYSAIVGRDASNEKTWAIGNLIRGSLDVQIESKLGSILTLGTAASFNRSLSINGQVQPSDFSNLDARYFTQTAANQRFAQLVGNNTFRGINNFVGEFNITRDNAVLVIKNATAATGLYLLGQKADGTNKFYLGTDNSDSVVNLHNYTTSTTISLSNVITTTKTVKITGQVQPSDWANIDSRYIPAATLSTIARTNGSNTFTAKQVINTNGEALVLQGKSTSELYIMGKDYDGTNRWYVGNDDDGSDTVRLYNYKTGKRLSIGSEVSINANLVIGGQVQPSNFTNFDARYYGKDKADSKYFWSAFRASKTEAAGGVAWDQPSGIYLETKSSGQNRLVLHMASNAKALTPSAQLRFESKNGGMWYRSARDTLGFEVEWSKVYTEAQKPTPSEIGAYTKAETDQKIAEAISDSTDLNKIYPVGIVTWFNSNVNPNTALPGLTWTYLKNGVGRTIRIAAANGSDVATTGGSDSVTLAVGNLPSHTHSFSATTSSFDYGTKNTNTTGAHTHSVSGSTSSAGNHNHSISWIGQNSTHYSGGGGGSIGVGPGYTDANGAHTHSVSGTAASAGNHAHSVGIGAHSHTVSGNTGGTGSGSAFSVTNQFYKLMAWVRTA
ncbi:tail fibers protein [Escherichia phage Andreotti]|uniref:Tail fibers protein n=1 Tax=Escherichia phage Andreotti TaxID=2706841 RepID=A0A7S5U384_9CAUD|nr:tail fibers protein [Escherichia phage Andreotti]